MNELLGWYGFDDMDRSDLSAKTSRLLQSAAANGNNVMSQHPMEKRRSRGRATTLLQLQQQNEHMRNIRNNNNNSSTHNSNRKIGMSCNNYRITGGSVSSNGTGPASGAGGVGSVGGAVDGNDSTTSDHDTRSSREEDLKSPLLSGNTTVEEKIDFNNCCWCRRPVPDNAPEFLTTSDGPRYCSESCFTQSRRASFKKAKTCDWCKHVRHAVSYVDFQDGASQLQFCSDKCLNQYKMQIFCKETQAHLDMNPHLREQGLEAMATGNGAGLITPDLWLRNCRSRSASPASTLSASPGPSTTMPISPPRMSSLASSSASTCLSSGTTATNATAVAHHKPMISVAPVSKLMSKSPGIMQHRHSPKHNRKKRPLRSCVVGGNMSDMTSAALKANHVVGMSRELSGMASSSTSGMFGKSKSLLCVGAGVSSSPGAHGCPVSKPGATNLSHFAGSSVQDLHMSVPPLSPMLEQQQLTTTSHQNQHQHQHQHPHPHPHPHAHPHLLPHGRGTNIPTAFFATPPSVQPVQAAASIPPPSGFPQRPPPFLTPNSGMPGLPPRFGVGFTGLQQIPPMLPPDMTGLSALLGAPPPVTVMVPYPIIIPLPIPIPVPLPVVEFYKAHLNPAERKEFLQRETERKQLAQREADRKAVRHCVREEVMPDVDKTEGSADNDEEPLKEPTNGTLNTEEPLDFTKSKVAGARFSPSVNQRSEACVPKDEEPNNSETDEPTSGKDTFNDDANSPLNECITHCIVAAGDADSSNRLQPHAASAVEDPTAEPADEADLNDMVTDDAKQKLPKFKITRLQTKRTLIQAKESECSRPLRKRKRIIDCDFQKITLRDAADEADSSPCSAKPTTNTAFALTEPTAVTAATTTATPSSPIASSSNTKSQCSKK